MSDQPRFRAECDQIEITRGPTPNYPGDAYRKFMPGPTRFYIDDAEVTQDEFNLQYNAWLAAQRAD